MSLNYSDKIRVAVEKKGIKELLHFTNCENLKSISEHGLLTRAQLDEGNIPYEYNDTFRYDGCLNSISVSISFPNYKMLYRLMQDDTSRDWAIVVINPRVIYEKKCAFCAHNAGSTAEFIQKVEDKMTYNAFEKCFEDDTDKSSREEMNLADKYTTNPQSEVLVFDKIELSDIIAVLFRDIETKRLYEDNVKGIITKVRNKPFSYRSDYEYWR